ncbi:MAG TPA: hypothetical protein VLK85_01495 [Ramlibacter sp.]|nr:hypothetical protein [Ramlibacter sp.]
MLMMRAHTKVVPMAQAKERRTKLRADAAPEAPISGPKPLQQAQAFATLIGQSLARSGATAAASATLLPLASRADVGAEWIDLQFAVLQRAGEMQQQWMGSWQAWLREYAELPLAETLSEHMEQQYNLVEQFAAQLKSQAADVVEFAENVQVDYGYWVAQKTRGEADQPGPVLAAVKAA